MHADARSVEAVSLEEYEKLISENVIDRDLSYDEWSKINDKNEEARKLIEYEIEDFEKEQLDYSNFRSFNLRNGDILITDGTSSAGFTGHAGIVVSNNRVLHIAGPGFSPTVDSISEWHASYTNKGSYTAVYRPNLVADGMYASGWADNTYRNSNASYSFSAILSSTSATYCSKIVWQAYYYGVGSHSISRPGIGGYGYVLPYELPGMFTNDTSLVHTYR